MRITLEYVDSFDIEGLDSGDTIRVQEGLTLDDFLDKLNLDGDSPEQIKPVVNGEEVSLSWSLDDGDEIKFLPDA
ncbi:MAG: MoaD/ThiS family protein [bacterium]